jgi:hypothetical protein
MLDFRYGFLSKAREYSVNFRKFIMDGSNDDRIRTFAVIAGCTHDHTYAPRLGLFCLNLINNLKPDNLGNHLLEHPPREFLVLLDTALSVIKKSFEIDPEEVGINPITFFSIETIKLDSKAAETLIGAVSSMAKESSEVNNGVKQFYVDVDKLMAMCVDVWIDQNEKNKVLWLFPGLFLPIVIFGSGLLLHSIGGVFTFFSSSETRFSRALSLLGIQKHHEQIVHRI